MLYMVKLSHVKCAIWFDNIYYLVFLWCYSVFLTVLFVVSWCYLVFMVLFCIFYSVIWCFKVPFGVYYSAAWCFYDAISFGNELPCSIIMVVSRIAGVLAWSMVFCYNLIFNLWIPIKIVVNLGGGGVKILVIVMSISFVTIYELGVCYVLLCISLYSILYVTVWYSSVSAYQYPMNRAGLFRYLFYFSIIKNDFLHLLQS